MKFEDDYQLALGEGHELINHAMEVVTTLKHDYDLYIVTNGVIATQYSRLKDSGLYQHFKQILYLKNVVIKTIKRIF